MLVRPGSPGRSQFEEVSFSALAKFIEEEENAVVLFGERHWLLRDKMVIGK